MLEKIERYERNEKEINLNEIAIILTKTKDLEEYTRMDPFLRNLDLNKYEYGEEIRVLIVRDNLEEEPYFAPLDKQIINSIDWDCYKELAKDLIKFKNSYRTITLDSFIQ